MGMTFEEALTFEKSALWHSAEDEFLLDAPSGIVWWRPCGDGQVRHDDSWRLLPWDKRIPADGWTHGPGCDCQFCRRAT